MKKQLKSKKAKVKKVFKEFGAGKLKSGSKTGPTVTKHKQAVAIALSESGQSNKDKSARMKAKKKGITSRVSKALS
jgi:hypothetical protein